MGKFPPSAFDVSTWPLLNSILPAPQKKLNEQPGGSVLRSAATADAVTE